MSNEFLAEVFGEKDLETIRDKLHMYNSLMKPYTGEPFSMRDKHTWEVLKSVVTNERTKLLEQKLGSILSELRFFESLEVNLEEIKSKDIVKRFRKVFGDE